ncbi:MAG: cytochrome c-type biogenesis CcmF C-terminal domain-containing protein, partial [Paracoccaceae bacterium]
GIMLGVWLVAGAAVDLGQRCGRGALVNRLGRMRRLPRSDWGRVVAHAGLGITFIGATGLMAWELEDIRVARIGEAFQVADISITLDDVRREQGPNYVATVASMTVMRDGREIAILKPERRAYRSGQATTTEAAIKNGVLRDIYLVIGDRQEGGGWAVRSYIKPLANWIWLGAIVMAIGGGLSLSDRRYRIAAGAARKRPSPPAEPPAVSGVPAE